MAAGLIQIDEELLSVTIFSIDDAIKHQSYFCDQLYLPQDHIDKAWFNAEHVLQGESDIGGQEHFDMETDTYPVISSNDDQEVT